MGDGASARPVKLEYTLFDFSIDFVDVIKDRR